MSPETVRYSADGLAMLGQLFVPAGRGLHAGVLAFPEAFGIGNDVLECAGRLAALGYALADVAEIHQHAEPVELEHDLAPKSARPWCLGSSVAELPQSMVREWARVS